ncbi:MAG: TauD/TfdA family dioxygenase [Limisphaerales bacterium]
MSAVTEFELQEGMEAWTASLDPGRVFFTLNGDAQDEMRGFLGNYDLFERLSTVQDIEAIEATREALPLCAGEVERLEREQLKSGVRLAVVKPVEGISLQQQIAVPWILGNLMGTTLAQNEQGDRLYIITDRGGKMEQGARYSQTNQGGSFHTDGVNLKEGYDYFLLSCIAPAADGGESVLLNGYSVFEDLRANSPATLDLLNRDLVWEYKGIYKDRFYHEPIIKIANGEMVWRYLRNYIEEAAVKQNEPLSEESVNAMDQLDAVMDNPNLQFRHRFEPGETAVINDKQIFHGRTAFVDGPDAVSLEDYFAGITDKPIKRTYSRIWVNQ